MRKREKGKGGREERRVRERKEEKKRKKKIGEERGTGEKGDETGD